MEQKKRISPYDQTQKIIVQFAIFRWENAVILAGTILLTAFFNKPFPWWPVWGWLAVGLVGMGGMFISSLTNTQANARLLLDATQRRYDLGKIRDKSMKAQVQQGLDYQDRIISYLNESRDESVLWGRAEDTARQLYLWVENVYQLAVMVDRYRQDKIPQKELTLLPREIQSLKDRQANEKNSGLVDEYAEVLASKEKHLEAVKALDLRMKQAALHLEQSLSALATVDSQIRLLSAHTKDRGKSERLQDDIQSQVQRLADLLDSIQEITAS